MTVAVTISTFAVGVTLPGGRVVAGATTAAVGLAFASTVFGVVDQRHLRREASTVAPSRGEPKVD
ncbi:hypothetical protein [Streptomyces adustus]|uniref:hypothetical protein n=1 Tax=Streptomyces adustus TaxID=1609272 RepID=UPI00371395D2